jgi:hypothetical protein
VVCSRVRDLVLENRRVLKQLFSYVGVTLHSLTANGRGENPCTLRNLDFLGENLTENLPSIRAPLTFLNPYFGMWI